VNAYASFDQRVEQEALHPGPVGVGVGDEEIVYVNSEIVYVNS
jgi:hypothetical protein